MGIMGNKFRYYLTYQGVEHSLIFAPRGWEDQTLANYRRDLSGYFGMIRSLSLPLTFVKDGYNICRLAFLNDGYEAGVILRVEVRQRLWNYKTIFQGDLDFSKYVPNGTTCDIPLMESGITRDIKAKENTKYEYLLEGEDIVNIIIPGVRFNENSDFITKYVDTTALGASKRFMIGIDLVNQGFRSGFVESRNTSQRNAADSDDFTSDAFVIGKRAGGQNVRIRGYINGFTLNLPTQPAEHLQLYFVNTVTKAVVYMVNDVNQNPGTTPFNKTFDFNYTLQENEGLALYSRADSGSASTGYTSVNEGQIGVSYDAVSDPSNCRGISGFNLMKRVLTRINPNIVFNSTLLQSVEWKDLLFTSGSAIRELDKQKIKISFKELFDTWNGILDAGFGTDGGVSRLERGYVFARDIQIADLGKIGQGKYSMAIAEELVGNVVNIGYDDGQAENDGGLQEYNSRQVYGLPTTRIQKELNWISPVRADQYGMERLRVLFNVTKQSENNAQGDNDNFMIDCYLDGVNYRPILGATYDSVTGVENGANAWNLRLTPKQNLLRHSAYLASILDRMNGRTIEFASGEKNTDLVTVKGGMSVAESSGVAVSSLGGKYFQPYIFTITAKFPKYVIDLMDSTPFGWIAFSYNGIKAKGYMVDVAVDLAENSEREIKLLATWDSLIP